MGPEGVRLSRGHQAWLHAAGAVLFATGAAWLVLHHFLQVRGEFGDEPRALEPWCLRLHGAAAMGFLVLLGTLVRGHLPGGWRSRRNRVSGVGLVSLNLVLIATGWALYYLGGEIVRPLVSVAHWGVGVGLPFGLLWHARRGLATRVSRSSRREATGSVRADPASRHPIESTVEVFAEDRRFADDRTMVFLPREE